MGENYTRLKQLIHCDTDLFDPVLSHMYTPEEIRVIEAASGQDFDSAQAAGWLGLPEDRAEAVLEQGYRKGVLNKCPGEGGQRYEAMEMYGVLDFFVLGDPKRWSRYDRAFIEAADAWYFGEYAKRVEQRMATGENRPSEIVLPLEPALDYIATLTHDLYVLPCDCRSVRDACGHAREVCIQSIAPEVNSVIDRGFGRRITKEEAKDIVRMADREGLIHSPTSYHFCNCCTDCCYPFRYSRIRGSLREWPKSEYLARVDGDACVGCGLCAKRCPLSAISIVDRKAVVEEAVCVGCGVCRVPCKKDAISMEKMLSQETVFAG